QNDTWILSGANGIATTPTWTKLNPTAAGPSRRSHTAIYDPVSNEMVIFGGSSQLPQVFTDDHVLILTKANGLPEGEGMQGLKTFFHVAVAAWLALLLTGIAQAQRWSQDGPVPRFHQAAIYDSVTDNLIVFGGAP